MDTLFWKNLSPKIEIESSNKQFYKQYHYKLTVHAPGCASIRCENILEDLSQRRLWTRSYNRGGSWRNKKLTNYLDEADVGFLSGLKHLYSEYPDVKIRCEEPTMSIYATDELMLQSIAKSINPDYRNKILSITGPYSDELKSILTSNVILVKKPPKYRYRIWFKEKQFDEATRQQVFAYLESLGDLVRMTDHTRDSLTKPHNWIWGCYFYTNDQGVAAFVKLINPDLIREVSEMVCANNK